MESQLSDATYHEIAVPPYIGSISYQYSIPEEKDCKRACQNLSNSISSIEGIVQMCEHKYNLRRTGDNKGWGRYCSEFSDRGIIYSYVWSETDFVYRGEILIRGTISSSDKKIFTTKLHICHSEENIDHLLLFYLQIFPQKRFKDNIIEEARAAARNRGVYLKRSEDFIKVLSKSKPALF
jgi:hypothetical protein